MDVAAWLRGLGLEQYERAFLEQNIEADVLPELTADDLIVLGVASVGHRRKLLSAIAALRPGPPPGDAPVPPPSPRARQPEVQRRQLTVMFCDLVGSTALAARLDPEDLREVIRGYQDSVTAAVQRFGGHVAKYLGDGVVVYFGWPQAHEDDGERAVRAGLAVVEALARLDVHPEVRLQARVGIATGTAVVGDLIGEGASREEAVVGDTPNLAARLQGLAEPGAVVVEAATRRLVGRLFELRDLGRHDCKGLAEPVQAWQVAGEAAGSRFEALRGPYRTPLVGRERELAVLEAARREAEEGRGQLVAAVGEPGAGKSRLVEEFLRAAPLAGWRVHRCGCRSYGTSTPWQPVIELIRTYFGIRDRDDRREAADRIEAGLAALGAGVEGAASPLRALLDLPVDDPAWPALGPPQRRRRMIDAVKGLLLVANGQAPLALLVEDLHWADGETVALLDSLVESLPGQRMLVLVTYRPEFRHGWGTRTCYQRLRVDPLPRAGAERLLAALLGTDPALADLKHQLIARTEGNPLFLEEAVRDLAERGALTGGAGDYVLVRTADQLGLPQTVQAILSARIDRLSAEARQLLGRAAVIGPNLPRALLEAVGDRPGDELDQHLAELQAAEMLHETRVLPELEYAFRHALIHDVAYAGLLRDVRRTLHRRVAEAIEALYPERLTELAESLADHFERGGAWGRAAEYFLRAAEKAKQRYAYRTALGFAEKGEAAAGRDPALEAVRLRALELRGDLQSLMGELETANQSYDAALALLPDPEGRRRVENKRHRPGFALRDGVRIAYYLHGAGDETLLFVNPVVYGLEVFQPILERLCQTFRIVTIDPRGTGASDPLQRPYGLTQHALDVRAVIEQSGVGAVTGVGISRGSNLLVRLAHTDPGLVRRLVLIGAPTDLGAIGSPTQREDYLATTAAFLARDDVESLMRYHIRRVFSEPDVADLAASRLNRWLGMPRETLLSFYDSDPDMDIRPLLPAVRVPTLILHGTEDRQVPFAAARYLAAHIPGAKLYPFVGYGHVPLFTATQEFCDLLRDFVLTGTVPNHR